MSLSSYITFLKAHEKLLIIAFAGFLALHFYGAGLNAWIDHDKREATTAAQKVADDAASNAKINAAVADAKKQNDATLAQINREMAILEANTAKQKKADDIMIPADLAQRLQTVLKVGPQEVTASPVTGDLVFTPSAAHAVADDLEDLQAAKTNLADLNIELLSEKNLNTLQATQVAGLQTELVDEKLSHQKDVDLERAKSKRSWFRGFRLGVVVGAVGGIAISHWL